MAMDTLKEKRFLEDVSKLRTSVEKGNIKLVEKVGIRVGRLKERYPSIAGHYDIQLEVDETEKIVRGLSCEKKETRQKRSVLTGCYEIETSNEQLSTKEVWRLYMTLN